MYSDNPLDHAIQRFHDRWETDRQFRSAMSGVFGLLLIFVLCAGVSLLDMGASRVLAAIGLGTSNNQDGGSAQQNIDTGVVVNGNIVFPTATYPTWAVPVIPQAQPNPTSSSQFPTPTPVPTATDVATTGPCTSNCGGGTVPGHISASWSPATWVPGQSATFIVHATDLSGNPKSGVGVAIIYTWANSVTFLDENPKNATDASGNYTSSIPVVGNCPKNGADSAYVQAHFPGSSVTVSNTWPVPCV